LLLLTQIPGYAYGTNGVSDYQNELSSLGTIRCRNIGLSEWTQRRCKLRSLSHMHT